MPRRVRSRLLAPAIATATLAAAALAAACADSPVAPAARSAATGRPAYALLANGGYWESFNFAGAQVLDSAGNFVSWANVAPAAWRPADFDVAIHSRDQSTWYNPEGFRAMHGTMCQPYQAPEPADTVRAGDGGSHAVATYDEMNYRCRNHMMTALRSAGYGMIYVTPNAMVDFTAGEASVKFALSTLRTSGRDWVDLWVTPWDDNLKLPLDAGLPDMQGPPRRAIHLRMTAELTRSAFEAYLVSDFKETKLASATAAGYESILTPVSTRRDTFELKISRTHLSFGMKKLESPDGPAARITWIDTPIPTLPVTRGVLQFGHHSFNPALAADPALPAGVGGTWHWDDFQIAPAAPFTIVTPAAGSLRYADAAHPTVTFAKAAPDQAYLRFAAYGDGLQVSTDGVKWAPAVRQAEGANTAGRFHSYWTPVRAGATAVQFRTGGRAAGTWFVSDVTVWSQAAPAALPQMLGGRPDVQPRPGQGD